MPTAAEIRTMKAPRKRRILCICDPGLGTTSGYRLRSLERLGQQVLPFNIRSYEPKAHILRTLRSRFPIGPFVDRINRDLLKAVEHFRPDVVWFDKPVQFTRNTIEKVKGSGALTVCYTQDAPVWPQKGSLLVPVPQGIPSF